MKKIKEQNKGRMVEKESRVNERKWKGREINDTAEGRESK